MDNDPDFIRGLPDNTEAKASIARASQEKRNINCVQRRRSACHSEIVA
jgi:hypothetical protein